MTDTQILKWIKTNLGAIIRDAIAKAKEKTPNLLYTEDHLGAIAARESGGKIAKLLADTTIPSGKQLDIIAPLIRGDYTQRKGDVAPVYHGYGFWQADIASFSAFIKSGDWKDPAKGCAMAIAILEDKRLFLQHHFTNLTGDALLRAVTAAYNCGEGNVRDVLNECHDIDIRTTDKNYSAQIWQFREIYKSLA